MGVSLPPADNSDRSSEAEKEEFGNRSTFFRRKFATNLITNDLHPRIIDKVTIKHHWSSKRNFDANNSNIYKQRYVQKTQRERDRDNKQITRSLGKIDCKTVRHIRILNITRGVSMDETNSPEGDGEDKGADGQYEAANYLGADGQYEAAYDLGQIQLHDVARLCRLFLLLFVTRLDIQHFCFRNNV